MTVDNNQPANHEDELSSTGPTNRFDIANLLNPVPEALVWQDIFVDNEPVAKADDQSPSSESSDDEKSEGPLQTA